MSGFGRTRRHSCRGPVPACLMALGLLALAPLVLPAQSSGSDYAVALQSDDLSAPDINSQNTIKERLKKMGTLAAGQPYDKAPSFKPPYQAGSLQAGFVAQGLATLNMFRFLAGLEDDVKADPAWNDIAQHAAVLLQVMGKGLDHTPAYPAGIGMTRAFFDRGYAGTSTSDLTMAQPDLASAVRGFMDDSDDSNIDRLGHRRWLLNPKSDLAGFGYTPKYCAVKVFSEDHEADNWDHSYVAWPGVGNQLLGWFGPKQAWSFSINPLAFKQGVSGDKSTVSVQLKRLRDGKTWGFSKAKSNGYFNVETSGFGLPFCVIFWPDGLESILDNDTFAVTIKGVKSGGRDIPISYKTNFFSLNATIHPKVKSLHPKTLTPGGEYLSAGQGVQKVTADKTRQTTMGFVGPALEGLSWYLDGPDGVLPIGIELNGGGNVFWPGEMATPPKGEPITAIRLVYDDPNLKYTVFAEKKGWSAWFDAGAKAGFDDGTPIETFSVIY